MDKKRIFNNRIISFIIVFVLIAMQGCQNINSTPQNNSKSLNIVIETKDLEGFEYIEMLLENFKNTHKDYQVNIFNSNDLKNIKDNIINQKYDVIISSRETFLTLNEYGLIKDLTSYFNQNKSQSKFYDIVFAYGKVGNKNLGMGLLPSSIEILYNKNKLNNQFAENDKIDFIKSMIKNKDFKILYVLPKDLNINLAISSIVSNSIIKENNLVSIYNGDKNKYLDVVDIPNMFKELSELNNSYKINEKKFIQSNLDVLNDLNEGEIPLVITTSDVAKNLSYENIESLSNLGINNYKATPPILSRYTVCATSSSQNIAGINRFFDYLISDSTYNDIAQKGILTGNKKADSNLTGLNKVFLTSIAEGNESNIPYFLNLPKKFMKPLNDKLIEILDYDRYSPNYWKEIVEQVFK